MVACIKCQLPNSIDSRFCRGCGEALPADALEDALKAHEQMILEGHRLLGEHRHDEAALIADKAIEENPQSIAALTLRGDCYERKGQIVEALECYEKVVELKPDSTLDRIKLTQLRHALAATPIRTDASRRKSALFAAAGCTLAALAIGIYAIDRAQSDYESSSRKDPSASREPVPNVGLASADFSIPAQPQADSAKARADDEPPLGQAKAEEESAKSNPVARREAPNLNAMTTPRTGMLPPAGTIGSGNDLEARPLSPEIKLEVQPESPPRSIRNSISDDPAPVADTPSKPAEERPGVIEITPSKGTNAASSSQGDADMFRKIARDQFLAGRYQQAADSYLKALKAGAPAGMVYQRLGQCYEKLGRTADAVSSYRKAIAALSAGGASAANQAAIEACEQAIRALGG